MKAAKFSDAHEVGPHGALGQKTPMSLTNHRGGASLPP